MKNRTFLRSIIGILLVAQLWATVVSHCNWTADLEIELCDKGDSDPKEENTKEKDDKLKVDLSILKFDDSIAWIKITNSKDFPSIHHPESTTPPPESFIS